MLKMDYIEIKRVTEYLKRNLKPSRFQHSLGVVEMATRLAKIYGADEERAYVAALTHDIAKCLTPEESNRLVRFYGLDWKYYNNSAIAHSKLGAEILRDEFCVTDEEILSAVAYHTTGKEDMTLLEEIIYVSDAIEINRIYEDAERLRQLAERDLHRTCLEVLKFSIESLRERGREIDFDTIKAYNYILNITKES